MKTYLMFTGIIALITITNTRGQTMRPSLYFSGIGSSVTVANDSILSGMSDLTIGLWYKQDTVIYEADEVLVSKNDNPSSIISYSIYKTENLMVFGTHTTMGQVSVNFQLNELQDDTWHHITGVYNSSNGTVSIYRDGELMNTSTQSGDIVYSSDNLLMGLYSAGQHYRGELDRVSIWKRALSIAEIQQSRCEIDHTDSNLVGYWAMDEGSGGTVSDSSVYQNDGIINGAQWATDVYCCAQESLTIDVSIAGLTVNYFGTSIYQANAWLWDFGDSTTSTLEEPSHTYEEEGTYEVCLTITSNCGVTTTCQSITLCNDLVAGYAYNDTNLTVSFQDQSTGSIDLWNWSFGDGNSSSQVNPTHTYASAGSYDVCLTVAGICESDTFCKSIAVTDSLNAIGKTSGVRNTQIFPNPAREMLYIESNKPIKYALVFNALGQSVIRSTTNTVDISRLKPGHYFILVDGDYYHFIKQE